MRGLNARAERADKRATQQKVTREGARAQRVHIWWLRANWRAARTSSPGQNRCLGRPGDAEGMRRMRGTNSSVNRLD